MGLGCLEVSGFRVVLGGLGVSVFQHFKIKGFRLEGSGCRVLVWDLG